MITKKDLRFIELARTVAMKSTFARKQVGAVAVRKGKVIAQEYNRSSWTSVPMKSRLPKIPGLEYFSTHAEASLLLKGADVKKATVYLFGLKYGSYANAVPCPLCRVH